MQLHFNIVFMQHIAHQLIQVYAVSTSLLGLSSGTGSQQIKAMANAGYQHEILESIEAMKMATFINSNGGAALQVLVQNTLCVLNGLQFIANIPNIAIAAKIAALIATDATILPNITALGKLSGEQNLLFFNSVGPLMPNTIPVQAIGSAQLLQAQKTLGCAAA
ncbi:hypothetical protein BC830DRAFT_1172761 [Chytriomyces sp. MP71]|nr:hypothetical protein BC830DRAFT_1172761 [Chytriomyces sp. MP71]